MRWDPSWVCAYTPLLSKVGPFHRHLYCSVRAVWLDGYQDHLLYNDYLPYHHVLDAEADKWIHQIKTNLTRAVLLRWALPLLIERLGIDFNYIQTRCISIYWWCWFCLNQRSKYKEPNVNWTLKGYIFKIKTLRKHCPMLIVVAIIEHYQMELVWQEGCLPSIPFIRLI